MSAGRKIERGTQLAFDIEGPFPHVETPAPPKARIMVDQIIVWPGAPRPFHKGSCHLTCDGPLEELHAFAKKLGMRRSWFQDHRIMPHYDLTPKRRAHALELGAVFVEAREQAKVRRAARKAAAGESP